MHIPDGFLDAKTAVVAGVLAAGGVGVALRSVRQSLPPRRIPMLGMASAFVFAAQMINFPVAGGTSGHLIGAVLTAVLLGPAAAVVVMTSVLVLQCFLFQDGGLTALGANVFNLGVVASTVGYGVYAGLVRFLGRDPRTRLLATAFAAWCSTMAAALVCAGQLALSGTAAWRAVLPAMAGIHALIGLGEAAITALVVAAVGQLRPELILEGEPVAAVPRRTGVAVQGMLVALGLVVFVAPWACGWPDGLEAVAGRLGFEEHAAAPILGAPWPDYAVPGWDANRATLSTILAGGIGTMIAFGFSWILARVLSRPGFREWRAERRTPAAGS